MHPGSAVPKSAQASWPEGWDAKNPIRWSGSQREGPEDSQRVPRSKVAGFIGGTLDSGEAKLPPCALQRVQEGRGAHSLLPGWY